MATKALPWERIRHIARRAPDQTAAQIHATEQAAALFASRFTALGAPLLDPQNVFASLAAIEIAKGMFATAHKDGLVSHDAAVGILAWLDRFQICIAEYAPAEARA